jgi:hypothetical protein
LFVLELLPVLLLPVLLLVVVGGLLVLVWYDTVGCAAVVGPVGD